MKISEKINVSFPNEGPVGLDFDLVVKWDITDPKEIGDNVFFWSGGIYFSVDKSDYEKLMKFKPLNH